MTVHEFLTRIAEIDDAALGRAVAQALAVERPCSPESYRRLYLRVLMIVGNGSTCASRIAHRAA